MSIERAPFIFEQVVKQVDGHNQQRDDHGGDDETGAKVDAFTGKVYYFAIIALESRLLPMCVRIILPQFYDWIKDAYW